MKRLFLMAVLFVLGGCSGSDAASSGADGLNSTSDSEATITEVSTTGTASVLADYDKSHFSNYIYFHQTESKILIDFAFFPDGSDPDSQAKTISIPCLSTQNQGDSVADGLSASTETTSSCANVSLNLSEATFTNDGLVFSYSEPFTLFASDYDFNITRSGFVDSGTGEAIAASVSSRLSDVAE